MFCKKAISEAIVNQNSELAGPQSELLGVVLSAWFPQSFPKPGKNIANVYTMTYPVSVEFDWNDSKNAVNFKKHGSLVRRGTDGLG